MFGFCSSCCPYNDTPPNSLTNSNVNLKVKTMEEKIIGLCFLAHNISRVERCARVLGWGLGQMTSGSFIHIDIQKPNNKLVSA